MIDIDRLSRKVKYEEHFMRSAESVNSCLKTIVKCVDSGNYKMYEHLIAAFDESVSMMKIAIDRKMKFRREAQSLQ